MAKPPQGIDFNTVWDSYLSERGSPFSGKENEAELLDKLRSRASSDSTVVSISAEVNGPYHWENSLTKKPAIFDAIAGIAQDVEEDNKKKEDEDEFDIMQGSQVDPDTVVDAAKATAAVGATTMALRHLIPVVGKSVVAVVANVPAASLRQQVIASGTVESAALLGPSKNIATTAEMATLGRGGSPVIPETAAILNRMITKMVPKAGQSALARTVASTAARFLAGALPWVGTIATVWAGIEAAKAGFAAIQGIAATVAPEIEAVMSGASVTERIMGAIDNAGNEIAENYSPASLADAAITGASDAVSGGLSSIVGAVWNAL